MNTRFLHILLLCGLCGVNTAAATDFLYTLGIGSAQGDYGTDTDVSTYWLVNNLEIMGENWSIEGMIPVLRQDSSDLSWVGGMPMPRGSGGDGGHGGGPKNHHHPGMDDPSTEGAHSGLADPILRFKINVIRSFSGASVLKATMVTKLPAGDESLGFSTGEWDYGAGLLYSYSGYRSGISAELTYWRLGDPPDMDLENPLAFRIVAGFDSPGGLYLFETFLTGQTEIVDGIGSTVVLGGTLNRDLTTRYSIFGSAALGLTDAASDFAFSAGLRIRF